MWTWWLRFILHAFLFLLYRSLRPCRKCGIKFVCRHWQLISECHVMTGFHQSSRRQRSTHQCRNRCSRCYRYADHSSGQWRQNLERRSDTLHVPTGSHVDGPSLQSHPRAAANGWEDYSWTGEFFFQFFSPWYFDLLWWWVASVWRKRCVPYFDRDPV